MTVKPLSGADVAAWSLVGNAPPPTNLRTHHVTTATDTGLQLQFETCQFPGVVITHVSGAAAQEAAIASDDPNESVNINFQLAGAVHSQHNAYNAPFQIRAAQHNLLYTPHGAGTHTFFKGSVQSIHFRFDVPHFYSIAPAGDGMVDGLLKKISRRDAFLAHKSMLPLGPQLAAVLQNILACPLDGAFKKLYLEGKVLELLALELAQAGTYTAPVKNLSTTDIQKIHQVRDYLDVHYLLPLSLAQLAREAGLNEFKLKKGFRDVFETTVFNHIHQKRMQLALKLLAEKVSTVSEVADTVGYKNANHFSAAFKKFFGYSPGSLK